MKSTSAHGVEVALRVLLAAAASLVLCGCSGHWEDYEKILGYRGKARLDPFLAAERLLDELGHDARAVKALPKLPAHDAVLFISGENPLPAGRARQLLSWTYSGGHLIYCMGGTRPYNDFDSSFGSFIAALLLDEQKDPLLEQLGVGVEKRFDAEEAKEAAKGIVGDKDKAGEKTKEEPLDKSKKPKEKDDAKDDNEDEEARLESLQDLSWNGQKFHLSLGGHLHFVLERALSSGEFSAGPAKESLALHLQHGMGQVTLLAHGRPFRNRWIAEHDHARWLSALVGEQGPHEVLFVAANSTSLMSLLWQQGWMALVALAVCLIFWLWRQMPRFGPLAEVELDSTRHFASHVGALGEFFWRMRKGELLVAAAREAVWERLRERHRSLDDPSRQMSDLVAEQIAARTGLSVKRVTAVFDVAAPTTAHNFVNLMRDLQTIRRAL